MTVRDPELHTILVLICLLLTATASAQPVIFAQPLSSRIANYAIDVSLNAEDRTLDGQEVLIWYNRSEDTLAELQFHLYLNAFRNNKSTLFEESGHWRGTGSADDEGWGYSEITRIATATGEDLTGQMEFIQPDDSNEHDKTVFRLPLPKPLKPGDSVMLEIDFSAKLPTPPFRTGVVEEYFFVGQWYPKVGVHIDGAWNCHQFHSASEFFADFGVYDVHITVPSDHIVGATGIEVEVTPNDDGTATHYYHAEDVHDFAWTSSPEFVEFTGDTQDVQIRVLMQPDRVSQMERYLEATKLAIAYMQEWIGDYPYPNVTVVDPRRGAIESAGMEYPTLFTTLGAYGLPRGVKLQESTTIHEFAHSYWHLMLATNEFEEPWLDEGFTVYTEARISAAAYGPVGDQIDVLGVRINNWTYSRIPVVDAGGYDQMARNAWEYYSEGIEAINAYFKPALMLRTLEHYLGEATMTRILRTYYERWRFKHPHTHDFIAIVNEVSGQDLNGFFGQVLYGNAVLDYSVSYAKSRKIKPGEGYDFGLAPFAEEAPDDQTAAADTMGPEADSTTARAESTVYAADSQAVADSTDKGEEKDTYLSEVKVRRLGGFVFPVTVEIKFDDGETIRETWDGRDHWRRWRYTRQAELVSATVDPDFLIPLDINYTNNSRTVEPQGVGVAKLCVRALFWAQFLLEQPDFFNLATLGGAFSME